MARRQAAQAAPEPAPTEAEETSRGGKRGPGILAEYHAAYLKRAYGVDITPELLYLAQSTRKEFRETEGSGYEEAQAEIEKDREERGTRRAKTEEAAPAEAPAAPAKATRGRARKAAAEPAEQPAEEAPTRRRSRATKAAAPAAPAEAPATEGEPTRRRARKAPF